MNRRDTVLALLALALAKAGILAFIVAMPGPALAQPSKSAVPSPRGLLRGVLDVVRSEGLTNPDLLSRKLGLQFVAQQEHPHRDRGRHIGVQYPWRVQSHDKAVFDLKRKASSYDVYQPFGKSYKRAKFTISLATETMCITVDDFLAVFGAGAEKRPYTDSGGFEYRYAFEQGTNEMSVEGYFGNRKCMQDLTMSQNMERL